MRYKRLQRASAHLSEGFGKERMGCSREKNKRATEVARVGLTWTLARLNPLFHQQRDQRRSRQHHHPDCAKQQVVMDYP